MRKIFTLLFLLTAFSIAGQAQYYYIPYQNANQNPGNLNNDLEYPVGGGLSTAWTSILTGGLASGTYSSNQTLPFTFSFNGGAVTQYKVSNTGVLTFNTAGAAYTSTSAISLPSASIPDQSVVVLGINGSGSSDEVVTRVFGSAPNRQLWVMFSSYTSGAAWTYWSIVLEETTNNIYIVDQRHSGTVTGLTLGVQINSTTAAQVVGSPNVQSYASSDPSSADNSYYKFIQGTQPSIDMEALTINLPQYNLIGNAPFTITGDIRNDGSSTVTSYTLNYSINGGATVSSNVTGVSIPTYGIQTYTHGTGWTPATAGVYTIAVWATNINGMPDQNTSNDTVVKTVNVVNSFVPRKSIMEVFTSSTCGPCKPGNENTTNIFGTNPNAGAYSGEWTMVKFQQDFPGTGDPYATAEAIARRAFYSINSIPRLEIDGQWDGNASSMNTSVFESYQSIPSFLDIDLDFTWDGDQKYEIDVTLEAVENISATGLKLYTAIVEKETFDNIKSNGETEFQLVMKKMVPSGTGTNVGPFTANTPVTVSQSYEFKGNYRLPSNGQPGNVINHATEHSVEEFNDLAVVVWVQDPVTKEVYQSEYSEITNTSVNSIGLENFKVFPNPTSEYFTISFESLDNSTPATIEIFNMVGQRVAAEVTGNYAGRTVKTMDVSNLSSGMYIVKVTQGAESVSKKVSVQ